MISSRDTLQFLLSIFPSSLFLCLLDQPTSTLNDVQLAVSSSNQEQGSCILHVEEQSVGDMSYLSSLFQDDNFASLDDHRSYSLENLSNYLKPCIQVETLGNHHLDIHVSIDTYGDQYPSTLDDTFASPQELDLKGIDPDSASPFMGWDTLSILNDPKIFLFHTSLDTKYEEESC